MSLENLLRIGQLKAHPPDGGEIGQLLAAAQRNLGDSRIKGLSPESRFDIAYKSIMQAALAALMAHGYRPDTSRPGHHMTVIQGLTLTIGLPGERMAVLDAMRRKRAQSDYTGADIDEGSADACTLAAEKLLKDVRKWLQENRPTLKVER